jgi:hypothetical protein
MIEIDKIGILLFSASNFLSGFICGLFIVGFGIVGISEDPFSVKDFLVLVIVLAVPIYMYRTLISDMKFLEASKNKQQD